MISFISLAMNLFMHLPHEELYLLDHIASSDQTSPASATAPPPDRRDSAGSRAPVGQGGAAGPGTGSPDSLSHSPPSAPPGRETALQGETKKQKNVELEYNYT